MISLAYTILFSVNKISLEHTKNYIIYNIQNTPFSIHVFLSPTSRLYTELDFE